MTAPERIWLGKWWSVAPTKTSEDDAEYVRADLAAVPAQVRVKPLVWTQIGSSYRAPAPLFGHIRVEDYASGKWSVLWSAPGICDTFTAGAFYTPEAAKAAAQSDYAASILAAIEPQPDPRDEVIARLVEALEMMRSIYPYNPPCYGWQEQVEAHKAAKAAIAAAKAVQHD